MFSLWVTSLLKNLFAGPVFRKRYARPTLLKNIETERQGELMDFRVMGLFLGEKKETESLQFCSKSLKIYKIAE